MPALWENRLKVFKAKKEARDEFQREIQALAPSKPFAIAERLYYLYKILEDLEENGDEVEQIPNAKAIISAYRSGDLEWFNDNRVTYWHNGEQICQPKEWDADDFIQVVRERKADKGFWVEGVRLYN